MSLWTQMLWEKTSYLYTFMPAKTDYKQWNSYSTEKVLKQQEQLFPLSSILSLPQN